MKIDIRTNILEQFHNQFKSQSAGNELILNKEFGNGSISLTSFPDALELYNFQFQLNTSFELSSHNPIDSDWLLLNINLSQIAVDKKVNDEQLNLQKYLPAGILFYPPNTNVSSISQPNIFYHIVLIRFTKDYLFKYLDKELEILGLAENAIIYEDLEPKMENDLLEALNQKNNKISRHASILAFMASLVIKLEQRNQENSYENLHQTDIQGLFMASACLRNPGKQNPPSVEELASIAGMGLTKFKNTFKQVFGIPPAKYHFKIKMDYARKQLVSKNKNVSEISHEIGYSHPSKFSAAYKSYFGILPSQQN